MPDGQLIELDRVTKRFGAVAAVSDFSARVNPGVVTGFLGPNGAGKTTTLRMLLGLERPTIGTTKIGGKRFSELRDPARVIGAMLENPGFRARRTVERHLITAAKANGIPLSRVGELISFVGLGDDVDTRIAALSLGMRQRLSAATALIGDPGVLVLDEPANGLDPEGIRWMRTLIRGLADEGRTVLVSSHVLSEVEQTADEILVIARGELKFAGTMEDLADPSTGPVVVDAADRPALSRALRDAGLEFEVLRSGLTVRGSDAARIGAVTAGAGIALTTLQQRGPTLEDVFLDLVNDRYVRPVTAPTDVAAEPADATPEADAALESEALPEPVEETPAHETTDDAEPSAESAPDEALVADDADAASADAVGIADADADAADADAATPVSDDRAVPTNAEDEGVAPDEGVATDETTAPDEADTAGTADGTEELLPPQEEQRPLPGIAGLAAVASLFNTPPSTRAANKSAALDSAAESDDVEQPADAEADDTTTETDDDLDATRVIDIVPNGSDEATESDVISDVPLTAADETPVDENTADETAADEDDSDVDATEEFFDAFTGDPASDDDAQGESAEDSESSDETHNH